MSHSQRATVGGYAVALDSLSDRRYPNLPYAEQRKVFRPTSHGFRKVILATGMAETSLSIDGVTCVIDTGFETVQM